MTFIICALGLAAGNFVFQFFGDTPNYALALERSFFQCSALATYAFLRAFVE